MWSSQGPKEPYNGYLASLERMLQAMYPSQFCSIGLAEGAISCLHNVHNAGWSSSLLLSLSPNLDFIVWGCRATAEVLMTNDIGKRMRALGKGPDPEVARLAKEVVRAWKKQLLED